MPRAISASPTLATLAMGPSGSGMTSPMGPARRKNSRPKVSGSGVWKEAFRSAVVSPTASSEGTHTGIQPTLTRTARPLEATPMAMAIMPGWLRLSQQARASTPKALT